MKFQIFSTKDNKALLLDTFDALYCAEVGEKYSDEHYGSWYLWLEGILRTYEDITKSPSSELYYSVVQNADHRRVRLLAAAKCLLIYMGRLVSDRDSSKDIEKIINRSDNLREFLMNHKNDYYFEFFY